MLKISSIYFELNKEALSQLCGDNVSWEVLKNRYAVNVKEYHDEESKAVYFIKGDQVQLDLLNYLLERHPKQASKSDLDKTVPISTLTSELDINKAEKSVTSEKENNDDSLKLTYEAFNLQLEIRKGDIVDEASDIIVVPINQQLQFNGFKFN